MRRDGHKGNGTMPHQNIMIIPHSVVDPDLSLYNVWRIQEANIQYKYLSPNEIINNSSHNYLIRH